MIPWFLNDPAIVFVASMPTGKYADMLKTKVVEGKLNLFMLKKAKGAK